MPPSPRPDPAPGEDPRQALIHAMLREHARLGSRDDEPLLAAVRARIAAARPAVPKIVPLPLAAFPAPRRRFSCREWMQAAAVVAVSLALIGLFLVQRQMPAPERPGQTFHLVSLPLTAVAVPGDSSSSPGRGPGAAPLPARSAAGAISFPGIATGVPGSGSVSFPDPLAASDAVTSELLAEFSVSAEKILRPSPDRLVYEGGVVLRHPDFTLEADRLELSASAGDDRIGSFVAEGSGLKIEKRSASGATEIARAETATYEAGEGGRLILAGGPPTLSAGGSLVRPHTPAGLIVLRHDGYQVIER